MTQPLRINAGAGVLLAAALALAVSLAFAPFCAAQEPQNARTQETVQSWPIWGYGNLQVVLPPDWGGELIDNHPELDAAPYVLLKSSRDNLFVSIAPLIPPDKDAPTRDKYIDIVKARVRELPERNPENTSGAIVEVPGPGAPASCVRIAFGQPDKDGFKCLTVAYAFADDQLFEMRVRTEQLVSKERERALSILKTVGMNVPSTQPADLNIPAPGKHWQVVITTPGFAKVSEEVGDASALMRFNQSRLGMELSVFLEPVPKAGDATVARDYYVEQFKEVLKKRPTPIEGPTVGGNADVALSQHLFPALRQKHVTAYLVQDGMWVTVHVSKRGFGREDSGLFSRILESIHFEPTEGAAPTTQPSK